MNRTTEFCTIIDSLNHPKHHNVREPTPASDFIVKAAETYEQISAFESLLRRLRDSYVNYHRYLPKSELKNCQNLSDLNRSAISQEVVSFISIASTQIQQLSAIREEVMERSGDRDCRNHYEHYRLVIKDLLNKLSGFTSLSDRIQSQYRVNTSNPCRLMSDRYYGCVKDTKEEGVDDPTATTTGTTSPSPQKKSGFFFNSENSNKNELNNEDHITTITTTNQQENTFAQRYIDEIASHTKLKEYNSIALKQKDELLKETKILKVKYSEDIQESQKMERTVSNISSLIHEFVQLIDSQSEIVNVIGEVSQDTTESVKNTDKELILTLERSSSHQWSMISFILIMAILLLVLDFLSP